MGGDRKAVIEQVNAAFAENNLEKVLSFCTDDFIWTMVGDSSVKGKDANKESVPHSYAFCDVYRFHGDKVAELTAFVIRTDKARHDSTPT
jgi:ketosteroid isomerase-like protein